MRDFRRLTGEHQGREVALMGNGGGSIHTRLVESCRCYSSAAPPLYSISWVFDANRLTAATTRCFAADTRLQSPPLLAIARCCSSVADTSAQSVSMILFGGCRRVLAVSLLFASRCRH